jgi:hypothetical protein
VWCNLPYPAPLPRGRRLLEERKSSSLVGRLPISRYVSCQPHQEDSGGEQAVAPIPSKIGRHSACRVARRASAASGDLGGARVCRDYLDKRSGSPPPSRERGGGKPRVFSFLHLFRGVNNGTWLRTGSGAANPHAGGECHDDHGPYRRYGPDVGDLSS